MEQPATGATVYLDHAAATPLRAEVAEVMAQAAAGFANPSSPHRAGRLARRILEDSRERILDLIGARATGRDGDRLAFTSGSTEANLLGILGRAAAVPGVIAFSDRDHASVIGAASILQGRGWRTSRLPVGPSGRLSPGRWPDPTAEPAGRGCILSVTPVCGQTGIVEDMAEVTRWAVAHPAATVHADATQAVGHEPVSFRDWGVTTLAFAPHKFGGPRGIGAVVIRGGVPVDPLVPGSQEGGLRGGTEAVALAAGFARALELAVAERAAETVRLTGLRTLLEALLEESAAACGIDALVVGGSAARAAHIVAIALPGLDRQMLAMAADLAGVCMATGTACASGSSEPAPVLRAMGLPPDVIAGTVRLSLGRITTEQDVRTAAARLTEVFRGCHGGSLPKTPHAE